MHNDKKPIKLLKFLTPYDIGDRRGLSTPLSELCLKTNLEQKLK
jgi:hypothetical protein